MREGRIKRVIVFFVLINGFLLALGFSGNWHSAETLICSDCHTIHNSQDGLPMRYDGAINPSPHLLRHADSLSLCLYCHDGGNPDAPDVVSPVGYTADPCGGSFENSGGSPSEKAHDLNPALPETPPGGNDSLILTCASCHDPHGSSNYRNLLENPAGSGNGSDVSVSVNQQILPDGSNPSLVYVPSNVIYKSGMSSWCNDCHTDFHGRTGSEEGTVEPWLRHPQERQISGSYGADYAYWSGTINNRVEVENPLDEAVPSDDDEVFCLSCHKAHGSSFKSALIYADGSTKLSTCQQCHNQ
ncbi:MAG: cytochrome c3 family protein [Acidobacteriota bacterium]